MAQISLEKPEFRSLPLWQDRRVRRGVSSLILYAILIAIGVVILMPLSWMLTAALKGSDEVVFTVPTTWFPTDSFHFENFWGVLTYEAYPLWRPTVNTIFLVIMNVLGTLLSNS
jgi:ABC-type glycerol-3-phosphate transport system permease component